jgi:hypothetical protein
MTAAEWWKARATEAFAYETGRMAGAPQGTRNHELFKTTCRAFEGWPAVLLGRDYVTGELRRAGLASGLHPDEVVATMASGLNRVTGGIYHPEELTTAEWMDFVLASPVYDALWAEWNAEVGGQLCRDHGLGCAGQDCEWRVAA